MTIDVRLNADSIDSAIKQAEQYKKDVERKCSELCERLASMGATEISLSYSRAAYDGPKEIDIVVEQTGNARYAIKASGEAVLFVEFGAGITYGDGHPLNGKLGMGPGTYPGKGHWDDPRGWWIPKDRGGGHTYGNPPSMGMYNTAQDLRREVARVAMEVFSS